MIADRLSKLAFWATMASLPILLAATFLLATSWIDRPFPGFAVLANGTVDSLSSARWTGFQHGIKQRDLIMAIDGVRVRDGDAIYRFVSRQPVGRLLDYSIERWKAGRLVPLDIAVPVQRFGLFDFVGFFLTFWVVGLFHYLVGFFVSVMKPGDRVARTHFLYCITFGTFLVTAFDSISTHVFVNFPHNEVFALSGFTALNLAMLVPRPVPWDRPWLDKAVLALGVAFMAFALWSFHQPLVWPVTFLALLAAGSSGLLLLPASSFWARLSPSSPEQIRNQAQLILWSALASFLPTIVYNGLAAVGHTIPGGEFSYFVLVIFPVAVAYTIVRHQLFDIEVIIKKTLVYALVTAALLPTYLLLAAVLGFALDRMAFVGVHATTLTHLIATATVALLFAPLRDQTKRLVDRVFFRRGYDFKQILTEFADRTRETLDPGQVLRAFTSELEGALYPSYMGIFLKEGDGLALKEALGLDPDAAPPRAMDEEWLSSRVAQATAVAPVASEGGDLLMPLLLKDELVGAVVMGPRRSDLPYKSDDLELVNSLGQQLALWVKNAQLFDQVFEQERIKRELEIAAEVQMGILPRELPSVPGLALWGISRPALECGGDLYDVIQLDEHRIGILVGDVAGKGVPAALMMAITMSIFRTLAPQCETAAETLERLNELIYRHRPSSKLFVAVFYAIYDSRTRTLRCANAGNPLPMIGSSGDSCRLEAKGMALGVMPTMRYEEILRTLASQETVMIYSDGLEDALDVSGEQFGEERLEAVFREACDLPPEALQQTVFQAIREFSRDASQFDDLTMVALRVE